MTNKTYFTKKNFGFNTKLFGRLKHFNLPRSNSFNWHISLFIILRQFNRWPLIDQNLC